MKKTATIGNFVKASMNTRIFGDDPQENLAHSVTFNFYSVCCFFHITPYFCSLLLDTKQKHRRVPFSFYKKLFMVFDFSFFTVNMCWACCCSGVNIGLYKDTAPTSLCYYYIESRIACMQLNSLLPQASRTAGYLRYCTVPGKVRGPYVHFGLRHSSVEPGWRMTAIHSCYSFILAWRLDRLWHICRKLHVLRTSYEFLL